MNQEKMDPYDKKHFKKTLELGKHTIFGREGGEEVNRSTKKKIASGGLFSTFCHPFAVYVPVYKLIFHILSRLLYKVFWAMEC